MNHFHNHIEYVVPENSEIRFSISPETRDVYIKLLDGVADIYVKDKQTQLQLHQEFPIPIWECSRPRLKTKTGCNFLVHGNHYVYSAKQQGFIAKHLFSVSPGDHEYTFNLEKDIQLEIFPSKLSELLRSSGSIYSNYGTPEISGFKLSRELELHPFFPVLLKSSYEKPYSVCVHGLDRKVRVCVRDENYRKYANDVKDHIFAKCSLSKRSEKVCPTILVLGPKNVGKTSFCRLIVNEALEKRMTPIYIDLNVKRNLCVPGSLSLSEINSRIYSTLEWGYNIQKLLHFGSEISDSDDERIYYSLVKKMGVMLSFHLKHTSKEESLSIIDTDEYQGENNSAIKVLLTSFTVHLVVYIGDEHFYENLKNSVLKNVQSKFIPKLRNAEQPTISYERGYCRYRIQKYFFGSTPPSPRRTRRIPFSDIYIYRILTSPNVSNARNEKLSDFTLEPVDIHPSMERYLFGVTDGERLDPYGIVEVKCYVYFTELNMQTQMATVIVPESLKYFVNLVLLKGNVRVLKDHEID